MEPAHRGTVYWLFGRGASIECGLSWTVPPAWSTLPRDQRVTQITAEILREMDGPGVSEQPYRDLLSLLATHTCHGWRHRFITTNWDYLLQKAVLGLGLTVQPTWLGNSHVSHMNGTVESLPDNSKRSPFLLEDDPPTQRTWSVEANVTYNEMIWGRYFVVVGISFECDTDRFLLMAFGDASDDLVVGESHWLVLNPDRVALDKVVTAIQTHLPRATILRIPTTFGHWLANEMPELQTIEVLAF